MIDDYEDMFGLNDEPPEEFEAIVGEIFDLTTGPIATEEAIVEALHTVYDPEIPVDIYELGLIYELDIDPYGTVNIEMSLTSPGCPVAGEMPGDVARTVSAVSGTGVVTVKLVWDPMWTPERMSEDARLALGMF